MTTGIEQAVIFICLFVIAFLLGKLITLQKSNTQTSQIAFGAALWSVAEARALRNAPIMQRVIERVRLVEGKEEDLSPEAKEMSTLFEAALNGEEIKKNKIVNRKTNGDPFDPKSLV